MKITDIRNFCIIDQRTQFHNRKASTEDPEELRNTLERFQLNEASLTYQLESLATLGLDTEWPSSTSFSWESPEKDWKASEDRYNNLKIRAPQHKNS